jgi:hypothetical protein
MRATAAGIVVFCALLASATAQARDAQKDQQPKNFGGNATPAETARAVLEDGPTRSYVEKLVAPVFSLLRQAYSASPQFDFGDVKSAVERRAMHDSISTGDFQTAVEKAALILDQQFADIDANLTSGLAYLKLGKPELSRRHQAIGTGLLKSIVDTKDGKSPEKAFEVITVAEEVAVLVSLALKPGNHGLLSQSNHVYDRLEAIDRNGAAQIIYFQIDRPKASLETPEIYQLRFPASVAGFQRGYIVAHENQAPGLGYSVKYGGDGWNIDVIIYDKRLKAIPDLVSETVRQEFELARLEVAQVQRTAVEVANQYYVKAPDNTERFICGTLVIGTTARQTDDYLCMTAWRGKFVKYRVTSRHGDGTSDTLKTFMQAWMYVLWPELDAPWREAFIAFARGDGAIAARLLQPLAERGDPRAQVLLGALYRAGIGVQRDPIRAHVLLSLAATKLTAAETDMQAFLSANLSNLVSEMSAGEIAEAQKQAREWKPTSDVSFEGAISTGPTLVPPSPAVPTQRANTPSPSIPTQTQRSKPATNEQKRAITDDPGKLDQKKLNVCRGC